VVQTVYFTSTRKGLRPRTTAAGLSAFASAIALSTGIASAQTQPAAAPASSAPSASASVQEVVVTAQKRSQNLQAVPISITALSSSDVAAAHVSGFDDLSRVAPALSFDASASVGTTNVSIRGVSSQAGAATVGLYIDDVSVTTKNFFYEGAVEPILSDLDRIEVLRGPQGTLYGDSSEGGTIRFIAKAPNMSVYTGEATVETSNTAHGGENYSGVASVSIPLVPDVLAIRISGSSSSDSGWIDHYTQALAPDNSVLGGGVLDRKGVNSARAETLHVTAKWTPGYGLTITPAFYFQRQHQDDSSAFYVQVPGLGLYDQDKLVPEPATDSFTLGSLNIQKDLGFATLTSITGVFDRQAKRQEDGTFFNSSSFVALLDGPPAVPLPTPNVPLGQALNILADLPSAVGLDTDYRQITQELRLSSIDNPGSRLHWVVGAYFAQQRVHNTDFQHIIGINRTFQSLFGAPMEATAIEDTFNAGVPGTTLFPQDQDESDDRTYREIQYSVYGQVDWDFLPKWHLSVGGREQWATEHYTSLETGFYQIGNLGFTGYPAGTPVSPYTQQSTLTSFTPKVTLTYDFTSQQNVYASAGEGYRLGGPTGPIVYGPETVCAADFALINQTTQPIKFGSDSLWTYELGSKGRYLDGRLTLNGAVFYTDWHNIQQQIYLPDCGYYFTENVGDARIYGGELEGRLMIVDGLLLSAQLSAESATVTRSINPITVPVGSHLIDVPQATADINLAYDWRVNDKLSVRPFIGYEWTGRSNGSYQRFTNTVALGSLTNLNYNNPAYGVVNANVTLSYGPYDVSIYAKNLLNDQTIIQTPEINTVYEGYTVRPRTIGVSLKAHF
jgi:outer membrane receptor protein involved in Fe transport